VRAALRRDGGDADFLLRCSCDCPVGETAGPDKGLDSGGVPAAAAAVLVVVVKVGLAEVGLLEVELAKIAGAQ